MTPKEIAEYFIQINSDVPNALSGVGKAATLAKAYLTLESEHEKLQSRIAALEAIFKAFPNHGKGQV